ncbi:hypothetical protein J7T55_015594 [Diaporthe amygdali]|uniref:uncharacterized protein n=1 Tax=Phomopsis amygdali TaxID=1214568 RepID=UPI0022FF0A74|nr:uncharacterized protein J7T55_015594 [Diaporthe amygdali]KAJ0120859.1 hypothetical protein J7T55_015594 [Diaporthe amygdali]
MDGVADEPSPASSTKQSTSQPSLLCQACQSVLTRDKLNFDEFHPHHRYFPLKTNIYDKSLKAMWEKVANHTTQPRSAPLIITHQVERISSEKFRVIRSDSGLFSPGRGYITLSHRWGDRDFVKLTRDKLSDFEDGLPIRLLRKTFQEALVVAWRMNIPYVWIDSLCIIQSGDNGADWRQESRMMAEVYSNSFCNISADWGDESNGLFFKRTPAFEPPCSLLAIAGIARRLAHVVEDQYVAAADGKVVMPSDRGDRITATASFIEHRRETQYSAATKTMQTNFEDLCFRNGTAFTVSYDRAAEKDAQADSTTYYYTVIECVCLSSDQRSNASKSYVQARGLFLKSVDVSMGRFERVGGAEIVGSDSCNAQELRHIRFVVFTVATEGIDVPTMYWGFGKWAKWRLILFMYSKCVFSWCWKSRPHSPVVAEMRMHVKAIDLLELAISSVINKSCLLSIETPMSTRRPSALPKAERMCLLVDPVLHNFLVSLNHIDELIIPATNQAPRSQPMQGPLDIGLVARPGLFGVRGTAPWKQRPKRDDDADVYKHWGIQFHHAQFNEVG